MKIHSSELLKVMQKEMKWRYKLYRRGQQQGLDMVWGNMMEVLKEKYLKENV